MHGLIVVDVQNDFSPTGALPVPDGDQVVPVINRLMDVFPVIAGTQDWHPANHESFASMHQRPPGDQIELHGLPQILWPDHCIQDTPGADFISGLNTHRFDTVFRKGINPRVDSYSSFFDNARKGDTGLNHWLRSKNVTDVFVVGLATDYCVRFSAFDALSLGFRTTVISDATRGVNLSPRDAEKALSDMIAAGIQVTDSLDVMARLSR